MTGILLPSVPSERIAARDIVDLGRYAESAGFESVWVGDHLQWSTPFLDPLVMLAGLAMNTERIRLGTSVILGSVRHPVPLAKSLLTLDHLCRGRLTVGLGVGSEQGGDFAAAGIDISTRGPRMEATVRALSSFFEGKSDIQIGAPWGGTASIQPGPYRSKPPILLGGHSDAAFDRIVRLADGWIGAFCDPGRFAKSVEDLRNRSERRGRDPATISPKVIVYVMVGTSRDEAVSRAERYFTEFYGIDVRQVAKRSLFGTSDYVLDGLNQYILAGADELILASPTFDLPDIEHLKSLDPSSP